MARDFRLSFGGSLSMLENPESFGLFVAYESQLGALRVDRISEKRHTTALTNYQLNRLYHVIKIRQPKDDGLMSKLLKLESGASSTASCVAARALPKPLARGSQSALSLGQLLLGADDQFLYLGRAEVRGLRAHAFEAYESQWPVFYRQPMVYCVDGNKSEPATFKLRQPNDWTVAGAGVSDQQSRSVILKTVAYVADEGQRLLLLEVYRLWRSDRSLLDKTSIAVHDFRWQLSAPAPGGERPEELFSLADACSASVSGNPHQANALANHYGQVNVLLASETKLATLNWLSTAWSRNLALLEAMQASLQLPSTMIHDMTSKLLRSEAPPADQTGSSAIISASFRLMEHSQQPSELVLLGRGALRESMSGGNARLLRTVTPFQSCFLLAAHALNRPVVEFLFHARFELCIIDLRTAEDNNSASAFELVPNAPAELYEARSQPPGATQLAKDSLSLLSHGKDRLKLLKSTTKLSLTHWASLNSTGQVSFLRDKMDFFVRSIEVTEDPQSVGGGACQLDDQFLADSSRFVGLRLLVGEQNEPSKTAWSLPEQSVGAFNWKRRGATAYFVRGSVRVTRFTTSVA